MAAPGSSQTPVCFCQKPGTKFQRTGILYYTDSMPQYLAELWQLPAKSFYTVHPWVTRTRVVPPSAFFWRSSEMWHRAEWQTEHSQTECFYVLAVWCLDAGASRNRQSFIYVFIYLSNDFFRSPADVVSNEKKMQIINCVDCFHLPRREVAAPPGNAENM